MNTYALVEDPGMSNEKTVREGLTYREAMRVIARNYTCEE